MTTAVLLVFALATPFPNRTDVPTWAIILAFAAYDLLVETLRDRFPGLQSFARVAVLDLPVVAIFYLLGLELSGPFFVLVVLTLFTASASMRPRGSLLYTVIVMAVVAAIAPTFPGWSVDSAGLRELAARLLVLAVVGISTTIFMRQLRRALARTSKVRDEAEKALRQSEERFRLLVGGASDYAIFMLSPDGRIESWNSGAERTLGYREDEVLGRHFSMVFTPEDQRAGRPEQEIAEASAEGRAGNENWAVRKNGERFWASGVTTPLCDQHGNLHGFAKVLRDITERKRTEEALESRARQQAAVAELGRRALADPDLGALLNQAVNLVAETLDVEYCEIWELLPDDDALLLRAAAGWEEKHVGRATVGVGPDSLAGYTLSSDSPVIVNDLASETRFDTSPFLREHGAVSGMSIVIRRQRGPLGILGAHTVRRRAFTEDNVHFLEAVANVIGAAVQRKDSEEQLTTQRGEAERLAELDRLRTDFVRSISHELRTPLTGARVGIGMLETSATDRLRSDERRLLRNAQQCIERLGMFIDSLLAYNQLQAGALKLDFDPLDMRPLVQDAVSIVGPLIEHKEQTLDVDLPEPLQYEGDARRLEQVVVNLLSNAHEHTPPGTRIAVSGRVADHQVLLSVRDNGPGIPPEQHEAVFRQFYRLGPSESGSGLGLAISRGIVELHGGYIWVESEPGRGTAFHVALPARDSGRGEQ